MRYGKYLFIEYVIFEDTTHLFHYALDDRFSDLL
jgi:hypothetical protein